MLLSYGLRQSRQPIYVDLDCSEVMMDTVAKSNDQRDNDSIAAADTDFLLFHVSCRDRSQCLDA